MAAWTIRPGTALALAARNPIHKGDGQGDEGLVEFGSTG
jgi:hypothetical protein